MIKCHQYYNYNKENVYIKEDKNTHLNFINISKGFTKDLIFFKGMACIFGAYSCHIKISQFLKDLNNRKID